MLVYFWNDECTYAMQYKHSIHHFFPAFDSPRHWFSNTEVILVSATAQQFQYHLLKIHKFEISTILKCGSVHPFISLDNKNTPVNNKAAPYCHEVSKIVNSADSHHSDCPKLHLRKTRRFCSNLARPND